MSRRDDVQIVYPVHLNPQVRDVVMGVLGDNPNVHLIEPLDYLEFVWYMRRAYLVLTDSGGVQEEAPHLGKAVLVMRNTTERARIVQAVTGLLDDPTLYAQVARSVNPYGDSEASERIVNALLGRPFAAFEAH